MLGRESGTGALAWRAVWKMSGTGCTKKCVICPRPASSTEFTISVERPAVEHRIRLAQVEKWPK
jgi:hypothetical protein